MIQESTHAETGSSVAALEFLTGPARGTSTWLSGATLELSLNAERSIRISEPDEGSPGDIVIARLHRSADTYEIEAPEGQQLWVNGSRVTSSRLQRRDLIELGETGPLTRFELYSENNPRRKSIADIVSDCVDYARVSRKPLATRTSAAVVNFFRSITVQTTVLFRLTVLLSLFALVATTYVQCRSNIRLQHQVESESQRLEAFARTLTRTQKDALSPTDLNALRQEMGQHLTEATQRLQALEQLSTASGRVIGSAKQSIVFLQGSYGFRDPATGSMLRYATDNEGLPILSPLGQPLLTLEGDGPVAARQFTGTAFVLTDSGVLLTNRHVALPWENDATLAVMERQGLEPALTRFIGYLPGNPDPIDVQLLMPSDSADLALLLCSNLTGSVPSLRLGQTPNPGDEVIVMGYPTGLRSILAQTGDAFIEELQSGEDLDFWAVAKRLAEERFIQPLASRGIVGQVTPAAIVYDAETTHGGSGGPVLDMNGEVVAVNTAIIPEYGGSNLGVPVEYVHQLLKDANLP